MGLRIFNTLTRSKTEFVPLVAGQVRMYVCGVTVYDLSHIGHARSAVAFDVIRRYLTYKGFKVTFVRNYTDIDDKIIRRANEEGIPASELSDRYVREYQADMASIGVLPGDVEPRATAHVPEMIALIERLVAKGAAYAVDGDVYFNVRQFAPYGRLSGKNLDDLRSGARVEVDERKSDPLDFALWKAAKPDEPSWPSPWGAGRPGWHIECSAMAMRYLGEEFDLHGGGEDLVFPHHENEIAQAQAATGRPFVRYWMHNAFVNLDAEKMSKSLGNTLLIRDLVQRHDPEALRLYLLGAHYRHPLEFADERVTDASRGLSRLRALRAEAAADDAGPSGAASDSALSAEIAAHRARFESAMDDDFNTPQALAALFDLVRLLNTARDPAGGSDGARGADLRAGARQLVALARVLGLMEETAGAAPAVSPQKRARIDDLIAQRNEARRRRDFSEADRVRNELQAMGVLLEDTSDGTTWKLAT